MSMCGTASRLNGWYRMTGPGIGRKKKRAIATTTKKTTITTRHLPMSPAGVRRVESRHDRLIAVPPQVGNWRRAFYSSGWRIIAAPREAKKLRLRSVRHCPDAAEYSGKDPSQNLGCHCRPTM